MNWLLALAQALLAAGSAYGAMHARVRALEKTVTQMQDRIDSCLSELNTRIDDLTKLASRLDGYLNGLRNGRNLGARQ
jgi:hypothetical protein